jgi:hypothetical protein
MNHWAYYLLSHRCLVGERGEIKEALSEARGPRLPPTSPTTQQECAFQHHFSLLPTVSSDEDRHSRRVISGAQTAGISSSAAGWSLTHSSDRQQDHQNETLIIVWQTLGEQRPVRHRCCATASAVGWSTAIQIGAVGMQGKRQVPVSCILKLWANENQMVKIAESFKTGFSLNCNSIWGRVRRV